MTFEFLHSQKISIEGEISSVEFLWNVIGALCVLALPATRMSESFTNPSERSFNWIQWVLQFGSPVTHAWQVTVFSGSRTGFEKYLRSPLSTGQRCLYPRLWISIWCYLKSHPAQESFLPWDRDPSSKELLGVPPAVRSWGSIGRDLFAEGDTMRSFAVGGLYPWKNAHKLPKRGKKFENIYTLQQHWNSNIIDTSYLLLVSNIWLHVFIFYWPWEWGWIIWKWHFTPKYFSLFS